MSSRSVSDTLTKAASHRRESRNGTAVLVIGHCAGLMDITTLPIWVGIVLIGQLALDPQSAGFLLTLFLGSVVLSSLYISPKLSRLNRKRIASAAYAVAGIAFATMPAISGSYVLLASAHVVAGLAVGCGLSIVHGTMGGTANPHRTAAMAFTTLSLVSILVMATLPPLVGKIGPNIFFYTMSGIMFTAALAGLLAFPNVARTVQHDRLPLAKLPTRVWFGIAGVSLLMVSHSMVFGFIERVGGWHGFSAAQITTVLVISGFVNLVPVALSSFLERHLPASGVVMAGPLIQATAAVAVTQFSGYGVYIVATSVLIAVVTFTHVFAFGVLARLDPSGRVVAATPVMVMAGSATGPLLGGVLALQVGYGSLGWAALALGLSSALCFRLGTRQS